MDFEQLKGRIIETLRTEMPEFKTVGSYAGKLKSAIAKTPVRFPAAYVLYEGSALKWIEGQTHLETAGFSVAVLTEDFSARGKTFTRNNASGLMEGVIEALTNGNLGPDVRGIRPLEVSLVDMPENITAYEIKFQATFGNSSGDQSRIKCCHLNILDTSTVSLSGAEENPACPLYRLYDRGIGRLFKTTSAAAIEIDIDQGAAGPLPPVDRLIVPEGHSLGGMTLDMLHSDDGLSYAPAAPQWTATEGLLINKSWQPIVRRYWKLVIAASSSIPALPELFLTATYEWESAPSVGPLDKIFNVKAETTSGGQDRFLVCGEPKRRRRYKVSGCGETQKNNIAALNDAWKGACPFYLCDHEGEWIFGRLKSQIGLTEVAPGSYSFEFDFIETLP